MTPIPYVPDAIWPDDYMDWVHRYCPVCKAEIHSDIYVRKLDKEDFNEQIQAASGG